MKHLLDDIREEHYSPSRAEKELDNVELVICPECGSGDISYTNGHYECNECGERF